MACEGWPAAALEFYAGLEDDNSKSYWTSRTGVYEDAVLHPMTELLELLSPEVGAPTIFRPYRDIRFSAGKTPYKTHIGATLGGRAYVQLSADHPRIGLLRHKGLTAWQHWAPAPWLHTASAAHKLQSLYRTCAAVCDWLDVNVTG